MTLAETVCDIRHRLAELVAEHGGWTGLVDSEAERLILQALEERDIDAILSAPDDVILADFKARGGDIEQYAAEMRQRFDVIARLTAELAAAHQVVEAARKVVAGPDSTNYMQLGKTLDIYDKSKRGHS
jgi:hypothetical protein